MGVMVEWLEPKVIADLVSAGAVAVVAHRIVPLLRVVVRLLVDTRRRLRALERLASPPKEEGHGAPDEATDDLERAAERVLGT